MICPQWSVLVALVLVIGCSRGTSGGGFGGTSAGGIGGASAGAGGDAAPPPQGLIFDNGGRSNYPSLERCDANGGCSAGNVCFHLTADIGLCDTAQPPVATMCTMGGFGGSPPDECSCDGGACGASQICINWQDDRLSGVSYNVCVDPACTAASDCAAGTVCTPSSFILARQARCFQPLCTSDTDCADGNDGRCSLLLRTPPQNGRVSIVAIRCVYAGTFDVSAPDPSLCEGTRPVQTARRDPPPVAAGFYYCPSLAH